MAEVILDHLTKIYAGENKKDARAKAIDNISFSVQDQEFMVIVGPSGCGKSTLLRMIAGLEEISEGSLSIDGKRINELSPRDRDIAMVFQNYALYPHMTVYDNMAFGLRLKHFSKSEIRTRVMETAALLEIESELQRKPKSLSGGQRQRVAIGRAIIRRPKVFLFDEPLSNLDAKLRSQMRIELQKLHREIKATIIYVTHDQTEAMTLGNRIAVLNKGNLMQLDTPLALYNKPINKFVAGFIGSPAMNFIKGNLVHEQNAYSFLSENNTFQFTLCEQPGEDLRRKTGKPILLGIRPEQIHICDDNEQEAKPDCRLTVIAYENMGNEQLVYFDLNGQSLSVRRPPLDAIELGMIKAVSFTRSNSLFFDPETGTILQ